MELATSIHDIKTLVLSFHPIVVVETVEESRVFSLLRATALELRMALFEWSITQGLVRVPGSNTLYETTDPLKLLSNVAALDGPAIFFLKDFSRYTTEAAVGRKLREVAQKFSKDRSTLVLSGARVELPVNIEHAVVRYRLQLPGREELDKVVQTVLSSLAATSQVKPQLDGKDRGELVAALSGMTLNQARQIVAFAALKEGVLSSQAIQEVLSRKAQVIRESGLLEYFPAQDNGFQMGGFGRLTEWLAKARTGFSSEARALNLPAPRGILLVGMQGCGKSLAAKVIARQWKMPLLKLDAGCLFDKFIGESESNLRKAIALAESMAPTVLWIDEIEKAFSGAASEADAGLSRRLFGSFLTWLQEKQETVFVVATANDLAILPPELLRKGRFDEIFFVDLPSPGEREEIWRIHLQLRRQDPSGFDLKRLVEVTEGFSGAEIEQAVIASLYRGLHQRGSPDTELLLEEISETVPLSVSRQEDIQRLRETARGRFVPVSH